MPVCKLETLTATPSSFAIFPSFTGHSDVYFSIMARWLASRLLTSLEFIWHLLAFAGVVWIELFFKFSQITRHLLSERDFVDACSYNVVR